MEPINKLIQEFHFFETNTNLIIHRGNFDITQVQGYMSRKQSGILLIFGPLMNKFYEWGMSPFWLGICIFWIGALIISAIVSIKFNENVIKNFFRFIVMGWYIEIFLVLGALADQYYMYHTSFPFIHK